MSISSLPQTRSGRHVIPQLAWWTGERVTVDPILRSIDIVPGTPNTQCASVPSDSYVSIALRYLALLVFCSRILKPATGRRLRFCVIAATGIRKHTQVESLWITRRIRRISTFPSNSERLDASIFTSKLPATKRNSRTISTRATDVIFERKHCSRRRSHTQVEITSPHKQLGNSETITRNRWHGARIS